jgi:ubiquitin-conjugating enzyme E2 A
MNVNKITTIRLTKELNKLSSAKDDIIELVEDINSYSFKPTTQIVIEKPFNIMEWKLKIKGPSDSPYEKGIFDMLIRFDSDYPFKAPSVKFMKAIYHPNIYRDGKICIDILQPDGWASTQTVRTIMISIISLFCDPNPASPANREAAELFVKNREEYNKKVIESIGTL